MPLFVHGTLDIHSLDFLNPDILHHPNLFSRSSRRSRVTVPLQFHSGVLMLSQCPSILYNPVPL